LDGEAMVSEGREERQSLLEELRDVLDKTSNEALMESEQVTQEHLQAQLNKIPLLLYTGAFLLTYFLFNVASKLN